VDCGVVVGPGVVVHGRPVDLPGIELAELEPGVLPVVLELGELVLVLVEVVPDELLVVGLVDDVAPVFAALVLLAPVPLVLLEALVPFASGSQGTVLGVVLGGTAVVLLPGVVVPGVVVPVVVLVDGVVVLVEGVVVLVEGVVVCGVGDAVCAWGVAVCADGDAVWPAGVAVCALGEAVVADGVAAVCAAADNAIPEISKAVNTLAFPFILDLLN